MATSDATKDLLWVIGIFIAIGVIWFVTGGPQKFNSQTAKPFLNSPLSPQPEEEGNDSAGNSGALPTGTATTSPYKGIISLGNSSNAQASEANREYVTIIYNNYYGSDTSSRPAVNITGWKLMNSRSEKYYNVNNNQVRGTSVTVAIPQGVNIYSTISANQLGPIILRPGDTATVVTGYPPAVTPVITNAFRVNKCSGYINNLPNHNFTPYLSTSCPDLRNEAGVSSLSSDCYDFIKYQYGSSCRTPVIDRTEDLGDTIDGKSVSGTCRSYINAHFNYDACVANHRNDEDFFGHEWRIWLNRPFEMWDQDRETISLYDSTGRLVDQIKY